MLTKHDKDKALDVKVGVVVVVDDGYETAVQVGIVYEEPGQSFDGARAEILKGDQRLRLGRGFGRLTSVRPTLEVELDLGQQDGVAPGDVYEVRASDGTTTLGRVKVVTVEAARSKATVLNRGAFAAGQEVVYQSGAADERGGQTALRILVCDFAPKADEAAVVEAGKGFARDLATHLREAATSWQGLEVIQAPQLVANDNEARALGKAYPADIVVWGTAMCVAEKGCALPVFTVVDPERLAKARMAGNEVIFPVLNPGKGLERGTAKDPAGLAFALLGTLAFDAQRFGDAAFYLARVPDGALEEDGKFRALYALGLAQWALGRTESTAQTGRAIEVTARPGNRTWEVAAWVLQARVLSYTGEIEAALVMYDRAIAGFEALGRGSDRVRVLVDKAAVLWDRGRVDEAVPMCREAQRAFVALGDTAGQVMATTMLARILADKGELDEALKAYQNVLMLIDQLGDRRGRAVLLGDIADVLQMMGALDEALRLEREKLSIFDVLQEPRERGITLRNIASMLTQMGRLDEAMVSYREALAIFDRLPEPRSRAMALEGIAEVVAQQGEPQEAFRLLHEALDTYQSLGDKRGRALALGNIARLHTQQGDSNKALKLHRERLLLLEELGDKQQRAIAMVDVARILAASGENAEALNLLRTALPVLERMGARRSQASARLAIARILANDGQLEEALRLQREAISAFELSGDLPSRSVALVDMAQLLTKMGRPREALDAYGKALEGLSASNPSGRHARAEVLRRVGAIHLNSEEFDAAKLALREAYETFRELDDPRGVAEAGGRLAAVFILTGSHREAVPIVDSASAAFERIGRSEDAAFLRSLLTRPASQQSTQP